MHPGAEWRVIASDPTSARDIYLGYVAPLAAIGIIAAFIGSTVIGGATGPLTVRTGIYPSLAAVEKTVRNWGYRRSYWADGNYVREEIFRSDRIGPVGMIVAGRFMIGARGSGVGAAQLHEAIRAVDAVKLARLAN